MGKYDARHGGGPRRKHKCTQQNIKTDVRGKGLESANWLLGLEQGPAQGHPNTAVSFWVAQTSYEMYEKRQNPGALATI
jgi:hypothetical protein